jgi:hypothetical protein
MDSMYRECTVERMSLYWKDEANARRQDEGEKGLIRASPEAKKQNLEIRLQVSRHPCTATAEPEANAAASKILIVSKIIQPNLKRRRQRQRLCNYPKWTLLVFCRCWSSSTTR